MKKSVLAKLKSKVVFLTSYRETDELVNNFKERQDEFDNGGIFVEIYDNDTIVAANVNVSKIVACIRKYTIEGDLNKDLDVYFTFEVDILDTPMGRKLINNNSSHNIEVYLLFDSTHKKFLMLDVNEYFYTEKKEFSSIPFFIVCVLTKQKGVSDNTLEEDTDCSDANSNEDVNDDECQDSCADSMCCDCEPTYSSKEYYELKKECIEKDYEIALLKRKIEALEYLIYVYISPDDRKKILQLKEVK